MKIFICSKPFQYITYKAVRKQLAWSSEECELWVLGEFLNSERIFDQIKHLDNTWNSFAFFKSKKAVFMRLLLVWRYSSIYVDSDIGSRNIIFAFSKLFNRKIYVIEEGVGIYSTNLLKSFSKFSGFKLKIKEFYYWLIGSGVFFGGSRWVDGIYVYEKVKYTTTHQNCNTEVYQIINRHTQLYNAELKLYLDIFDLNDFFYLLEGIEEKKIVLYNTSLTIDEKFLDYVEENTFLIIKPHPSLKESEIRKIDLKGLILKNSVPTEVVVQILLKMNKKVVMIHNNSSASEYLKDYIKCVNLKV